jgi:SRSO17 transposase
MAARRLDMDDGEVDRLADDLAEFTADVFGSLTRSGWQDRAGQYLRGPMLDGRRKSIQPMAARMQAVNDQALNHFVTDSPWDVTIVRQRLARRLDPRNRQTALVVRWAHRSAVSFPDGHLFFDLCGFDWRAPAAGAH